MVKNGYISICHFLVIALRAMKFECTDCSIDMNALRAMAYVGGSFSIDMNALWAKAGISRRETISIE
jgi:hypothetical protein